jgi:hypothetical protein
MSDDLGKKIQQIAELLGQDSVPDNVKELVALLANSMTSKEGASDKTETSAGTAPSTGTFPSGTVSAAGTVPAAGEASEKTAINDLLNNPELMNTARKALSRINSGNDPRINLLHAIKPFMSNKRQRKIGTCIQLLQVAGLSRLLNEHDTNPK